LVAHFLVPIEAQFDCAAGGGKRKLVRGFLGISETVMLSPEQVESYHKNGYLVVEDVIDPATVAELRRVTEDFVERARAVAASDGTFDLAEGHGPETPQLRRIKHPEAQHPVYDAVMRAPALLDIVEALVGPDVRFDHGKLNLKAPGPAGAAVEWHQDWAFYPHSNDDMLAVGVMLDDCDADNGPLLVVPGSHKGPVWDHHHDGRFCGALDPAAAGLDATRAVALTGRAGAISVHHVRLVHGSMENRSDRPRRLLLYSYAAADAWPLLGARGLALADLEEFDSRILRGQPTLAPRLTAVPVRLPLPPAAHEGSIFENQRPRYGRSFESSRSANQAPRSLQA
jgi:ectoine hydroxylase-related dioxygenase (phytanoyl-CoA dioxygenase family)